MEPNFNKKDPMEDLRATSSTSKPVENKTDCGCSKKSKEMTVTMQDLVTIINKSVDSATRDLTTRLEALEKRLHVFEKDTMNLTKSLSTHVHDIEQSVDNLNDWADGVDADIDDIVDSLGLSSEDEDTEEESDSPDSIYEDAISLFNRAIKVLNNRNTSSRDKDQIIKIIL